jgi:hypothetical protein
MNTLRPREPDPHLFFLSILITISCSSWQELHRLDVLGIAVKMPGGDIIEVGGRAGLQAVVLRVNAH